MVEIFGSYLYSWWYIIMGVKIIYKLKRIYKKIKRFIKAKYDKYLEWKFLNGIKLPFFWRIPNFFSKLKRSLSWFVFMWNNFNWDGYYVYAVMLKKLQDMEKFFSNPNNVHTVCASRTHTEIKRIVYILNNIVDNNYDIGSPEYKKLEEKWGELKMSDDNFKKFGISRPKVITEEDEKLERKESNEAHDIAQYRRKRDIKYLFKTLEKKLDCWWD
jgi:hypothetical protein